MVGRARRRAQSSIDSQQELQDPVRSRFPCATPAPPRRRLPKYESLIDRSSPTPIWSGVSPPELLAVAAVERHRNLPATYARRFTCDETARLAEYGDPTGDVSEGERSRKYAYLLLVGRMLGGPAARVARSIAQGRQAANREVEDEEPFPTGLRLGLPVQRRSTNPTFRLPAAATLEFDGFDLVHEIQFRGEPDVHETARTSASGKEKSSSTRSRYTPIEIIGPSRSRQRERLEALMYRDLRLVDEHRSAYRTRNPSRSAYKANIQFGLSAG